MSSTNDRSEEASSSRNHSSAISNGNAEEQPTPQSSTDGSKKTLIEALSQLNVSKSDMWQNQSGKDHKFWTTQPVPQFQEPSMMQTTENGNRSDGTILSEDQCRALIGKPAPLLSGFEWCELDLQAAEEIKELYELLHLHYVEDNEGSFRFNYSAKFLSWALMPPGWRKEWHVGVRTKTQDDGKRGKLVAFISAVPASIRVDNVAVKAVEINFLTVHRKLRAKKLAPVLIKEITRRCYIVDIFQALYTAGIILPTPVSTCRYFHRSLDWPHLYKNEFSHIPHGSSELRQKLKYKLSTETATKGLRAMKPADVPAVTKLLARYNRRFKLHQEFSEDEIAHFLCSNASKDVVWCHVVEQNGKITDVFSYYLLESTVLRSAAQGEKIRAAYLFYYASETAFEDNANGTSDLLSKRLSELVHDALILATNGKCHVFNALTLQDNPLFLREQKFEPGDGKLHYYLFNYRTAQLPGGVDGNGQIDRRKTGGIGIVML